MERRNPHFTSRIPPGDSRERRVCEECGFIDYVNPRIIVGAVVRHEDKILLCRRSIEPRAGYWTLPAGFMETGESPEQGAAREAEEEACATIAITSLLGIYAIPRISQVHLIYRAHLLDPSVRAGEETLEVALVRFEDVPWRDLAFPNVKMALEHDRMIEEEVASAPFTMTLP